MWRLVTDRMTSFDGGLSVCISNQRTLVRSCEQFELIRGKYLFHSGQLESIVAPGQTFLHLLHF